MVGSNYLASMYVYTWLDCSVLGGDGHSSGHMWAMGLHYDSAQGHSLFLAVLQSRAIGHDGGLGRRGLPSVQIFHNYSTKNNSSACPWNCGMVVSLHTNDVV